MDLELLPLLNIQRNLYEIPLGGARFEAYIATMTGGGDDIVLPLVSMNPMGKPHVAELIDTLIGFDAEGVVAAALEEAARRLAYVMGRWQIGLVATDDAKGGWTNRYFTEMQLRFEGRTLLDRGWIVVPIWTSEVWTPERVREEALTMIYRMVYIQHRGLPKTLQQMMSQEGLSALFAGAQRPMLDQDDLEYTREVISPYRDTTDYPTIFTCLYGDAAAREVGYPPLGLSPRAGYALALAEARQGTVQAEEVLLGAV